MQLQIQMSPMICGVIGLKFIIFLVAPLACCEARLK